MNEYSIDEVDLRIRLNKGDMQLQRPGRQSSDASACDRYHDGIRRDLISLTLISGRHVIQMNEVIQSETFHVKFDMSAHN